MISGMIKIGMFFFLILALAACSPGRNAVPTAPSQPIEGGTGLPPPDAPVESTIALAEKATALLAQIAGLRQREITFVAIQAKQWPDSCLGAARPDEACTQVVTRGYQVSLVSGGWSYLLNTNQDMSAGRLGGPEDIRAATSARQVAAQEMSVSLEAVRLVAVETVEWPDSCLGIPASGVVCLQSITPGYRVTVEVSGKTLEYHTDRSGNSIIRKP
jgi:hypothetical protein